MMGYSFHMGYQSTEFIQKKLSQYPSLYTLTIILKEFLHERGLLNAYQGSHKLPKIKLAGGISSYCLVIMILAILQQYGDQGYENSLRQLLSFYGEQFKPEKMGIALMEAEYLIFFFLF